MPNQIVGSIPEFTTDETSVKGTEEVKETPTEEVVVKEKETPAEPPAVETPALEQKSDDTETAKQVEGLLREKEKLLQEIQVLRGDRRQLKQEEIAKVEQKIEDLNIHPDDEALIDKILRKKGIPTQQDVQSMFYKAVEKDEVNKFLEKYPEYKPENDKNDINWGSLQREFSDYRKPDDPRRIGELLEKAHRTVSKPFGDRNLEAKKQQVKTASVGGGGQIRSSSTKQLDYEQKLILKQGGFSDEDIKKMEARLE